MAEPEHDDAVSSALQRLPRFDVSEPRAEAIRMRAHVELRALTASRRKPLLRAAVRASELAVATSYGLYVLSRIVTLLSMH